MPSRTRRKRTGVRPQPLRTATMNLKRVRKKRTVSKETKATLTGGKQREEAEHILTHANIRSLDGECTTVQMESKPISGTTPTRVMIMTTFSAMKSKTRIEVTMRLRSYKACTMKGNGKHSDKVGEEYYKPRTMRMNSTVAMRAWVPTSWKMYHLTQSSYE